MEIEAFRKYAHEMVDWMAEYLSSVDQYDVKPDIRPRDIFNQLANQPPRDGEDFSKIFQDFQNIILPGMTHWQHPNFHAYFNANSSPPSILGEMLTATLGAQCMIWDTSPAAAELEEQTMNWLRDMIGLPKDWSGVIHDTASAATLIAILTAREKVTEDQINRSGFDGNTYRVYCTDQTHSSIEKSVKIAGMGRENLVKVNTLEDLSMDPNALQTAIRSDKEIGFVPVCVVSSIGTTGVVAIDDIKSIAEVTEAENVWHHVDAAFAGTALILPEYQHLITGIEKCDSFVFNPHKWMFVNFDCTAYFVKDAQRLIKTFDILPEYLQTNNRGDVNDYRDWGIALGRRFRALKLWFVLKSYGVKGIQQKLEKHISLTQEFEKWVIESPNFEIVYHRNFNFLVFRFYNEKISDQKNDTVNKKLIEQLNKSGKLYLSHTTVYNKYSIRMVIGQTYVTKVHIKNAWELIQKTAEMISE